MGNTKVKRPVRRDLSGITNAHLKELEANLRERLRLNLRQSKEELQLEMKKLAR